MTNTPTIYEWAGGREAFARWLNAVYDLVDGDELLAPIFGGPVTREHRDHVTTWWCEVMGGADRYTADQGGYEHMLAKHRGLAITQAQRLRFVTLLSCAADLAELRADPEFRAAIMGYAEWGTRLAVENSAPDAARSRMRRSRAGAGASRRPTSPSAVTYRIARTATDDYRAGQLSRPVVCLACTRAPRE